MRAVSIARLAASLFVLAAPAAAQDGGRGMADMRTAEHFAEQAAAASQLDDIRNNLRRALNCLEGRNGPDYRHPVGDPCSGSGAASELPDGSINKIRVGKASKLAAVGATFHDFEPAHFTALAVRAVLAEGTQQEEGSPTPKP